MSYKILRRAFSPRTKNLRTCHTLQFQLHGETVSTKTSRGVDLKRTGCHTKQPTHRMKQREGQSIQPGHYSRVTIPCDLLSLLHFSPKGRSSSSGRCSSSVWNIACYTWNAKVETDAVSRFNRTSMLTHDHFEIRFGRSSSLTIITA